MAMHDPTSLFHIAALNVVKGAYDWSLLPAAIQKYLQTFVGIRGVFAPVFNLRNVRAIFKLLYALDLLPALRDRDRLVSNLRNISRALMPIYDLELDLRDFDGILPELSDKTPSWEQLEDGEESDKIIRDIFGLYSEDLLGVVLEILVQTGNARTVCGFFPKIIPPVESDHTTVNTEWNDIDMEAMLVRSVLIDKEL